MRLADTSWPRKGREIKMSSEILHLETVNNGSYISLVGNDGTIYATGRSSLEMLREAGFLAREQGYESIAIGSQNWEVAALVALS